MAQETNGFDGIPDEEAGTRRPEDERDDRERPGAPAAPESEEEGADRGAEHQGNEDATGAAAGAPAEGAPNGEPDLEILTEEREDAGGRMQKRMKRENRKELIDHLQKKNQQLLELDKELKKLRQDFANKEDRILRLAAEFENYKKRTQREWELLKKQANADLLREIAGSLDSFDRAFANLEGADERILEGLRLIRAGVMDVLRKNGLAEIDAMGARFDPRFHEAVGHLASPDVPEGSVAAVIDRGYMLNDEVLRPARVMISKGNQEAT